MSNLTAILARPQLKKAIIKTRGACKSLLAENSDGAFIVNSYLKLLILLRKWHLFECDILRKQTLKYRDTKQGNDQYLWVQTLGLGIQTETIKQVVERVQG